MHLEPHNRGSVAATWYASAWADHNHSGMDEYTRINRNRIAGARPITHISLKLTRTLILTLDLTQTDVYTYLSSKFRQ